MAKITADVHSDDNVMNARIIITVLLLLVGMFVYVPFMDRFKHQPGKKPSSTKKMFYSICACFAAGMLLSIAMVHIIPESDALYKAY